MESNNGTNKNSERVVIIGAGGHGKVVADIVNSCGDTVVGFLDGGDLNRKVLGYPVLGHEADYVKYLDCKFVVAIGAAKVRERIVSEMPDAKWYTAIHPSAVISPLETSIGEGTVVMANTVVNPGTIIGKHCIINTASVVEHENIVEDFAHISVGVKMAGKVKIGRGAWIGIGATVINCVEICEDAYIGAGAVVIDDIKENGTYVGVPAKKIH